MGEPATATTTATGTMNEKRETSAQINAAIQQRLLNCAKHLQQNGLIIAKRIKSDSCIETAKLLLNYKATHTDADADTDTQTNRRNSVRRKIKNEITNYKLLDQKCRKNQTNKN